MERHLGQTKRTNDMIDIRAPKRRARTTVPATECPAQTPTASIRDLFIGYEPDVAADCDDIDTLAQLDIDTARMILRMHAEAKTAEQEYDTMYKEVEQRIDGRQDMAARHVLKNVLAKGRERL
ncbi:hypothetical protein CBS147333_8454 [Penicillium roqueforti]|nr:hypothetical protein CBS147333_8454 [Penicillium roqueforti]KAI3237021.1 hypothetical protein DTO012A9_6988 [Penicillium roqueforti]KAI3238175.1 hypothetical protein CBS147310_2436 [Penicillium roqueforti]KAI3264910.1 hypothetical protein CBS147308_7808 [Penicillium roqueforti]KAI3284408.1 hypothetical protein DTO003C3_7954 [Penicillium roqueforti]